MKPFAGHVTSGEVQIVPMYPTLSDRVAAVSSLTDDLLRLEQGGIDEAVCRSIADAIAALAISVTTEASPTWYTPK